MMKWRTRKQLRVVAQEEVRAVAWVEGVADHERAASTAETGTRIIDESVTL